MKIVVAGMGNVLRGDDGFGVAVAHHLMEGAVPAEVRLLELGIGGIHLVQELLDPAEAVVVIDAVDLGRPPGTVVVLRPDVLDPATMSPAERHDQLADMHYATPARAFMLARGIGALPKGVWMVGCQPVQFQEVGEGLSPEVAGAVGVAAAEVRSLVRSLGVEWPEPSPPASAGSAGG